MKLKKTLTVLTILLLIPTLAFSAYVSKGSLYKFMEISGLNKQVAELPGMVEAGLQQAQQQQQGMPEELFTEIVRASTKAFEPNRFRAYISNEIRTGITENEAMKLIAWYETALGKEITAAEINASKPDAYLEMLANTEALMAETELIAKARKIDNLVGATDLAMEIQTKTAIAVYAAVVMAKNPGQKVDIAGFKNQLNAQKEQMRANAESLVLLSLVFTYKDIDPAKIDKYIAFLGTAEVQRANASILKGTSAAFVKSINNMAKSLRIALRKQAS